MRIDTGIFEDGDPRGTLEGPRVALDSSKPALRTCRYCGHDTGVNEGPKGPHGDGIRCEACWRHLGWLPKAATAIDLIE
jgi:hypothetical protein